MKALPKGPFLGINNRRPDFGLKVKDVGDFVRDAVNVDLDNTGAFRCRKASERIVPLTAPHSLYMTGETTGYLVRASALYAITLPTYTETLVKVLGSDAQVHWLEWNGDLYYSNGVDSGRLRAGVWYPLALPTLGEPAPSAQAGGTLMHGWYQVAISYYNSATGEEGGVSPSCNFELVAGNTLRVPVPTATPGATHAIVYCSTVNGSIPIYHSMVALGGVSYVDVTALGTGREANQRYEAPLPGGKLFLFNGCLCSYDGKNVYEGLPFRPGYYLPSEGRIPFLTNVTNCVPAQNGLYVVTEDKSYWIPGTRITADDDILQDVLPYGGVPHTEFVTPNKSLYGWFSASGFVLAKTNGEVEAVMSDNILLPASALPVTGVATIMETQEYRRVVSCGWCMNLDTKAETRYSDFDFTAISGLYATKADGIYLLEGAGDVAWTIDFGKENFGVGERKFMPAVYLSCTSDTPLDLQVTTPKQSLTYPARSCSDVLQDHRVDVGRGLSANWFGLSLLGTTDFTLAAVSFATTASSRRI